MSRVTRQLIVASLSRALAQPQIKTGMRLRPERELAEFFGVSRPTLRLALAELEKQGILAQQQGSGTYVRRLPRKARPINPDDVAIPRPTVAQLFVPEPLEKTGGPAGRRNRLNLQLWTHTHLLTPSLKIQVESFVQACSASGHDISIIGASTKEFTYLPHEKIASMLQASPCDGYLLDVLIADHALELFEATGKPFIVFSGSPPIRHEPAVITDPGEAIQRSVALLAREGYRRIALMSFVASELDYNDFCYVRAMRRAGLTYHCHLTSDVLTPEESRRHLLLQFGSVEPPDAVYISDDNLLPGATLAIHDAGKRPGSDFGVITMAVAGLELPPGFAWSQMQFRPAMYARSTLDNLLGFMQSSDHETHCEAHYYHWAPGETHQRGAAASCR